MKSALFLGDGFSTDYTAASWPCVLTSMMGWHSVNHSRPCTSFSWSFLLLHQLLSESMDYHTVIFTVTSMDRLYHTDLILHRGFPTKWDGTSMDSQVVEALDRYYHCLYDPKWATLGWIMAQHALASLSLQYPDLRFVIIPAFNSEINRGIPRANMVVMGPRLMDFSMLDHRSHQREQQGLETDRHCHLTVRQNQCLAVQIAQVLADYQPSTVNYVRLQNMHQL